MKKRCSIILAMILAFALIIPATEVKADAKKGGLVILYTNDVHCGVTRTVGDSGENKYSFGYSNVSAYKKQLEEEYANVLLVDAGDHIQGGVYGVLSKGEWMIDLMNAAGYDYATLGNHEFDYTVPRLLELAEMADYKYLSCNFLQLDDGEPVFRSEALVNAGGLTIGLVGITTPETYTKSTPAYFKNDAGEFIYSFCEGGKGKDLYNQVQKSIDSLKGQGADIVIALAHLGIDPASKPWTSEEVIKNTKGLTAVIDGHSHSNVEKRIVKDAAGKDVLLTQTGTKFESFGELIIAEDGTVTSKLITAADAKAQDPEVNAVIDAIVAESDSELSKIAGSTDYPLYVNNPETGKRMIRSSETNAGDFVADAYRAVSGADIAVVNGGGIRTDITVGDITVEKLISLHPFGNEMCIVNTTGQHIADLLEMAVSKFNTVDFIENGGFQHVSGLKYEADLTIPSPVKLTDKGEFAGVEGTRRVFNIQVYNKKTGKYEPINMKKEYTLASHNYMLKSGGDGLNMFVNDELLADGVMLDYQVVMSYLEMCNGKVPAQYDGYQGQGRITLYKNEAQAAAAKEAAAKLPQTGTVSGIVIAVIGAALMNAGIVVVKKKGSRQ